MFTLGNAVQYLIIANLFGFLIEMIVPEQQWIRFALIPAQVVHQGTIWQLVTYMFLHAPSNFMHILFNMLALWMFGGPLEQLWGFRRFMTYYFVTGIGAGVITVIVNYFVLPDQAFIANIGASGAVYGILLAFAMLFPNQTIFMYFLPVPAKYAVIIMGALELYFGITGTQQGVGHFAHLGGLAVGFLFLKWKGWGTRSWF